MESIGVKFYATHLHTTFQAIPGLLCIVSWTKSNTHFAYKLFPNYYGGIYTGATKPVGCSTRQFDHRLLTNGQAHKILCTRSIRAFNVDTWLHCFSENRYPPTETMQPGINLSTIQFPIEGLWQNGLIP